jgi:hypothetical protein
VAVRAAVAMEAVRAAVAMEAAPTVDDTSPLSLA